MHINLASNVVNYNEAVPVVDNNAQYWLADTGNIYNTIVTMII